MLLSRANEAARNKLAYVLTKLVLHHISLVFSSNARHKNPKESKELAQRNLFAMEMVMGLWLMLWYGVVQDPEPFDPFLARPIVVYKTISMALTARIRSLQLTVHCRQAGGRFDFPVYEKKGAHGPAGKPSSSPLCG